MIQSYRRLLALPFLLVVLTVSTTLQAAARLACAAEARQQAQRLLDFHVGGDDRIEIAPEVVEKSPRRNPANLKQQFQVLEVLGTIYKGEYRMRLIYYRLDGSCVLMRQEILEHASL